MLLKVKLSDLPNVLPNLYLNRQRNSRYWLSEQKLVGKSQHIKTTTSFSREGHHVLISKALCINKHCA